MHWSFSVLHIAASAYDCFEFEVLHDIFIVHDYRTSDDLADFSVWEKAMNIRYAQAQPDQCDFVKFTCNIGEEYFGNGVVVVVNKYVSYYMFSIGKKDE